MNVRPFPSLLCPLKQPAPPHSRGTFREEAAHAAERDQGEKVGVSVVMQRVTREKLEMGGRRVEGSHDVGSATSYYVIAPEQENGTHLPV